MILARNYNSISFNGDEASQIVLMHNNGYQIFSDDNVYLKDAEKDKYWSCELSNIKKANKTAFNDCLGFNNPKLINRYIPKSSIPYKLFKGDRYYGEGNWLFIKPDNVDVEIVSNREGDIYNHVCVRYDFSFQGLEFYALKYFSTTSELQARDRVLKKVLESISSYDFDNQIAYLEYQLNIAKSVISGKHEIKTGKEYENDFGDKYQEIQFFVEGKLLASQNRLIRDIESFLKDYDYKRHVNTEIEYWRQ